MAARSSLTMENLNPNIKNMQYTVRGPVIIKACEIEKELEKGVKKPFAEVIKADIGDCHAMGQTPITFIRQILALVNYPRLLDEPHFPDDVKQRARTILNACKGGSVGSYTDSAGIEVIRRHVAEYIEKRDGVPSDWRNIILTTGASEGIRSVLKLLICEEDGKPPGVLVPVPIYPLYSATLTEYGTHRIDYYLDESRNWGLEVSELRKAVSEAKKVCTPRAIVIINPGNPTGQLLTLENIQEIIKFAYDENLFILADEVYQFNVYDDGCGFFSFKKVLTEMGPPYSHCQLASFMSCSKGFMGECGVRGGYIELLNVSTDVMAQYLKSIITKLCPTVLGQVCMDAVVNPPGVNEPSFALYHKEKVAVLETLKAKADFVTNNLNSIEGFRCNPIQGSMYAFPSIALPRKAIIEAEKQGLEPDTFYAFELLQETGICIVPGSNFGQKPGTYHFRTTILPPLDSLDSMLRNIKEFHSRFIKKYS